MSWRADAVPGSPPLVRRILIGLLLADAALGWVAIQASFVFLELLWRAVAGRDNYQPLLAAHTRQFAVLRGLDAAVLAATAAAFVAWLRGVRGALGAEGRLAGGASAVRPLRLMLDTYRAAVPGASPTRVPALLGWWWAALLATLAVKGWAAARLFAAGAPVDLGRGLGLTILGSAFQLVLAVLTIFVVLAVQRGWLGPRPA